MNYLLRFLAFAFVGCFLVPPEALGHSVNSLALSVNSISTVQTRGVSVGIRTHLPSASISPPLEEHLRQSCSLAPAMASV
jgi:hypothetical protein